MTQRFVASVGVAAIAVGTCASIRLAGQTPSVGAKPAAGAQTWTVPRTPDGQPDLQGVWVNYEATPFEASEKPPAADTRDRGSQNPRVPARRSLVVDPPSGMVPVMPWAEQKRAYDQAHLNDSWVHLTPWERCITRGPGALFPTAADSGYQIAQAPGYVVIVYEILHEPRIIPVDGSSHLPSNIRLWNGDSRGHWEGTTLVVDTTNYNDKGTIASQAAALRIRGIPHSEALHLVERFTRVSADTINYEVRIEDPKVYTAPWTVAVPLTRDDSYKIYEVACHEGNRDYIEITLKAGTNAEVAKPTGGR
jgi:hypothetical protein